MASKAPAGQIGTVDFYEKEIHVEVLCGTGFTALARMIENTLLPEPDREHLKGVAALLTL